MTFEELMQDERFLKILQRAWDERGEVTVTETEPSDLALYYGSAGDRIIEALMQRDPATQRAIVRFARCFEQAKREWLQQH
jgi:hypothetical protein